MKAKLLLALIALLFIALLLTSCHQDEQAIPTLPTCPNVTVIERTADHIDFTIDSEGPYVTICNPYTGDCWDIGSEYYDCMHLSITTYLILNNQCVIE